jgi:hypothetical protein
MEKMTLQELIEMLIKLEKQYPNDYDLGTKVRELISNKLKQSSN